MPNKYFDKKDYEFIKGINKDKKLSKKILIYGALGLVVMGMDYYISNKFGIKPLSKSLKDMNTNELISTVIFDTSSFVAIGVSAIYSAVSILRYDAKNLIRKEKKNNVKKKNIEDKLEEGFF